ncbi:conserved membrane hypothetical protein [Rhodococcus sp. RD6.2]|jgi:hypothetical protein|uniref:hypothetical protein n=1 Tax=Rhodococcus sp. RD6.2 TaxID=260936 RepID=UPI00063B0D37|nr:hypothetical protein [Rhodococcus sp. RD6.2]CRK50342.1 conserved membrane hypothetical protein [Rhodococcus sp. RD6.2]
MPRPPLPVEDYASRISAYVYGNILVLTALIPLNHSTGITRASLVVIATSLSTFVAHAFAESVGRSARSGRQLTTTERIAELRDSVPVLTSGLVPALVVGIGGLGLIELSTALILAEIWVVTRIASITYVITRLRGERPTGQTLIGSLVLGVIAVVIVAIKLFLTH